MFIFTFRTYNEAIMWSRFERLFAVMAVICVVYLLESMGSQPAWIMTWLSLIGGQVLAIKCWADMIVRAEPHKNCWAFKD